MNHQVIDQIMEPKYIPNSPDNKITGYWRSHKDSTDHYPFPVQSYQKYPDQFIRTVG
jgi:hypothetical protein